MPRSAMRTSRRRSVVTAAKTRVVAARLAMKPCSSVVPATIHRADYLFRAVSVDAGDHRVAGTYCLYTPDPTHPTDWVL